MHAPSPPWRLSTQLRVTGGEGRGEEVRESVRHAGNAATGRQGDWETRGREDCRFPRSWIRQNSGERGVDVDSSELSQIQPRFQRGGWHAQVPRQLPLPDENRRIPGHASGTIRRMGVSSALRTSVVPRHAHPARTTRRITQPPADSRKPRVM